MWFCLTHQRITLDPCFQLGKIYEDYLWNKIIKGGTQVPAPKNSDWKVWDKVPEKCPVKPALHFTEDLSIQKYISSELVLPNFFENWICFHLFFFSIGL